MALFWIVIAVFCAAAEVLTLAFFAIFVALGAAGGAITAALGGPVWAQSLIAAGVAIGGIVLARPFLVHLTGHRRGHVALSAGQGLLGRDALTLDRIGDEHHPGHVLLAGERWLAVTEIPEGLPAEVPVTVVGVRGTTLVVWP